ncbi:hypothetical protein ACFO5Q_04090 [Kordiimonas lipolytica]|uniref:Transposase n=1 Tax=Kordiimonas lipolytica TaxID=1662421 RepID=A0ABV8U746_9PROT|nr:hypothetical protein [Kordiimonas lipolytica]
MSKQKSGLLPTQTGADEFLIVIRSNQEEVGDKGADTQKVEPGNQTGKGRGGLHDTSPVTVLLA